MSTSAIAQVCRIPREGLAREQYEFTNERVRELEAEVQMWETALQAKENYAERARVHAEAAYNNEMLRINADRDAVSKKRGRGEITQEQYEQWNEVLDKEAELEGKRLELRSEEINLEHAVGKELNAVKESMRAELAALKSRYEEAKRKYEKTGEGKELMNFYQELAVKVKETFKQQLKDLPNFERIERLRREVTSLERKVIERRARNQLEEMLSKVRTKDVTKPPTNAQATQAARQEAFDVLINELLETIPKKMAAEGKKPTEQNVREALHKEFNELFKNGKTKETRILEEKLTPEQVKALEQRALELNKKRNQNPQDLEVISELNEVMKKLMLDAKIKDIEKEIAKTEKLPPSASRDKKLETLEKQLEEAQKSKDYKIETGNKASDKALRQSFSQFEFLMNQQLLKEGKRGKEAFIINEAQIKTIIQYLSGEKISLHELAMAAGKTSVIAPLIAEIGLSLYERSGALIALPSGGAENAHKGVSKILEKMGRSTFLLKSITSSNIEVQLKSVREANVVFAEVDTIGFGEAQFLQGEGIIEGLIRKGLREGSDVVIEHTQLVKELLNELATNREIMVDEAQLTVDPSRQYRIGGGEKPLPKHVEYAAEVIGEVLKDAGVLKPEGEVNRESTTNKDGQGRETDTHRFDDPTLENVADKMPDRLRRAVENKRAELNAEKQKLEGLSENSRKTHEAEINEAEKALERLEVLTDPNVVREGELKDFLRQDRFQDSSLAKRKAQLEEQLKTAEGAQKEAIQNEINRLDLAINSLKTFREGLNIFADRVQNSREYNNLHSIESEGIAGISSGGIAESSQRESYAMRGAALEIVGSHVLRKPPNLKGVTAGGVTDSASFQNFINRAKNKGSRFNLMTGTAGRVEGALKTKGAEVTTDKKVEVNTWGEKGLVRETKDIRGEKDAESALDGIASERDALLDPVKNPNQNAVVLTLEGDPARTAEALRKKGFTEETFIIEDAGVGGEGKDFYIQYPDGTKGPRLTQREVENILNGREYGNKKWTKVILVMGEGKATGLNIPMSAEVPWRVITPQSKPKDLLEQALNRAARIAGTRSLIDMKLIITGVEASMRGEGKISVEDAKKLFQKSLNGAKQKATGESVLLSIDMVGKQLLLELMDANPERTVQNRLARLIEAILVLKAQTELDVGKSPSAQKFQEAVQNRLKTYTEFYEKLSKGESFETIIEGGESTYKKYEAFNEIDGVKVERTTGTRSDGTTFEAVKITMGKEAINQFKNSLSGEQRARVNELSQTPEIKFAQEGKSAPRDLFGSKNFNEWAKNFAESMTESEVPEYTSGGIDYKVKIKTYEEVYIKKKNALEREANDLSERLDDLNEGYDQNLNEFLNNLKTGDKVTIRGITYTVVQDEEGLFFEKDGVIDLDVLPELEVQKGLETEQIEVQSASAAVQDALDTLRDLIPDVGELNTELSKLTLDINDAKQALESIKLSQNLVLGAQALEGMAQSLGVSTFTSIQGWMHTFLSSLNDKEKQNLINAWENKQVNEYVPILDKYIQSILGDTASKLMHGPKAAEDTKDLIPKVQSSTTKTKELLKDLTKLLSEARAATTGTLLDPEIVKKQDKLNKALEAIIKALEQSSKSYDQDSSTLTGPRLNSVQQAQLGILQSALQQLTAQQSQLSDLVGSLLDSEQLNDDQKIKLRNLAPKIADLTTTQTLLEASNTQKELTDRLGLADLTIQELQDKIKQTLEEIQTEQNSVQEFQDLAQDAKQKGDAELEKIYLGSVQERQQKLIELQEQVNKLQTDLARKQSELELQTPLLDEIIGEVPSELPIIQAPIKLPEETVVEETRVERVRKAGAQLTQKIDQQERGLPVPVYTFNTPLEGEYGGDLVFVTSPKTGVVRVLHLDATGHGAQGARHKAGLAVAIQRLQSQIESGAVAPEVYEDLEFYLRALQQEIAQAKQEIKEELEEQGLSGEQLTATLKDYDPSGTFSAYDYDSSTETGEVTYSTGGEEKNFFHYTEGKVGAALKLRGAKLGEEGITTDKTSMKAGDVFVIVSDGVTDVIKSKELKAIIENNAGKTEEEIKQAILDAYNKNKESLGEEYESLKDDISIVVMKAKTVEAPAVQVEEVRNQLVSEIEKDCGATASVGCTLDFTKLGISPSRLVEDDRMRNQIISAAEKVLEKKGFQKEASARLWVKQVSYDEMTLSIVFNAKGEDAQKILAVIKEESSSRELWEALTPIPLLRQFIDVKGATAQLPESKDETFEKAQKLAKELEDKLLEEFAPDKSYQDLTPVQGKIYRGKSGKGILDVALMLTTGLKSRGDTEKAVQELDNQLILQKVDPADLKEMSFSAKLALLDKLERQKGTRSIIDRWIFNPEGAKKLDPIFAALQSTSEDPTVGKRFSTQNRIADKFYENEGSLLIEIDQNKLTKVLADLTKIMQENGVENPDFFKEKELLALGDIPLDAISRVWYRGKLVHSQEAKPELLPELDLPTPVEDLVQASKELFETTAPEVKAC